MFFFNIKKTLKNRQVTVNFNTRKYIDHNVINTLQKHCLIGKYRIITKKKKNKQKKTKKHGSDFVTYISRNSEQN